MCAFQNTERGTFELDNATGKNSAIRSLWTNLLREKDKLLQKA